MAHPARSNRERTVRTTPPQRVLQAAVGDQAGRQVEQHAGLALAALGLGPAALAGRHQQAHHHGDQQVDGQRQVVLGVVDDDVVVGLEEQQVEGEEPEGGGGDARPGPGGRRRGHHQQVGQDHGGLVDVAPDGEQRGGDQGGAGHGDGVAERGPRPARQPPRDVHATKDRPPRQQRLVLDDFFASAGPSFTPPLWPASNLEADQPLS